MWPCWRKCVTVEVDYQVLYMLKIPPRVTVHFLLPSDRKEINTMSACTLPSAHHDDQRLNL
ncbi:hypothetical protein ACRRTK_000769 [Alexandromys fortis]